jgi:hypothetical protein
MTRVIRLWDLVGVGLVIEHPSGVMYSNQTGGTGCHQPEVEGVLVPVCNDVPLDDPTAVSPATELSEYFAGPAHGGAGATSGLDQRDADFIDDVLRRCGCGDAIKVDRERLRESHEAWVRVNVMSEGVGHFEGFTPYPRAGVLTWPNTD